MDDDELDELKGLFFCHVCQIHFETQEELDDHGSAFWFNGDQPLPKEPSDE